MSASRDRRLPQNIFRLAPLNGWLLPGGRDAISRRPTPRRPIDCRINRRGGGIRRKHERGCEAEQSHWPTNQKVRGGWRMKESLLVRVHLNSLRTVVSAV